MKKSILFLAFIFFISNLLISEIIFSQKKLKGKSMEIKVESSAFKEGEFIPSKYTCDGENISPQIKWSNYPKETKSFALINDDPDAPIGDWVHWVVYNIPADVNELNENQPSTKTLNNGAVQGLNDWKKFGYGGPCPPSGTHRYFFKIFALDSILKLEPGATKKQLLDAMKGHILAEGKLMGKYSRKK
ncbi:MAG: YbhB/YbcL family Raf kinase inhibitor-like protein [Ignavibacteria bacterium]|nr:YbhB/YbcL family Raf kinase inhibitor-like protein [Ignavibacteria bacterium]